MRGKEICLQLNLLQRQEIVGTGQGSAGSGFRSAIPRISSGRTIGGSAVRLSPRASGSRGSGEDPMEEAVFHTALQKNAGERDLLTVEPAPEAGDCRNGSGVPDPVSGLRFPGCPRDEPRDGSAARWSPRASGSRGKRRMSGRGSRYSRRPLQNNVTHADLKGGWSSALERMFRKRMFSCQPEYKNRCFLSARQSNSRRSEKCGGKRSAYG